MKKNYIQLNNSYRIHSIKLTWLCTAVYFCSYLTRINYAAVMVEMMSSESFTKSEVSSALAGLFITYGFGQVISGYLGDRLRPNLLIFYGLIVSAAMNILIPISAKPEIMTVIWCINGFAQAFMWPPLVKIMSSLLGDREYKKATVCVSWGSSFGTIFVYLTVPLFITVGGWKFVFFLSAFAAVLMAFIWLFQYRKLEKQMLPDPHQEKTVIHNKAVTKLLSPKIYLMVLIIMLAIIMQGTLRDGITNWMPTYISEIFHMKSTSSIFLSVVLPLFSIITFQLTSLLNQKLFKNELLCAAIIFAIGFFSLLVLKLTGSSQLILTILMFSLSVGSMHGVNLILICMVPSYFKHTNRAAFVSGILNACTYIGSALSTYGIAFISERLGWDSTVTIWLSAALLGTLFCAVIIPLWRSFKRNV